MRAKNNGDRYYGKGPETQGHRRLYFTANSPSDVQAVLEQVRTTISNVAPDAKEVISYQMPAFKQHGILVYFAAWKKHIGLYPPVSGSKALQKALAKYAGPKGNLQFPLDEPIPLRPDRTDRGIAGETGPGESRGEARKKREIGIAGFKRAGEFRDSRYGFP